jgi:hypothetical protein
MSSRRAPLRQAILLSGVGLFVWLSIAASQQPVAFAHGLLQQPTLPPRPTLAPTLPPRPTLQPTLPPRPTLPPPTLPPRPTLEPKPPDSPERSPSEGSPSPQPTPMILPISGDRGASDLPLLALGLGAWIVGASLALYGARQK